MKIAFVRMRYVPYGGAENYLALVGKELISQKHEVHIFSNRWEGDDPELSESFIFHKVPIIKGISFLKVLSFAISSYFLIKKGQFDIIISFDRILYQDIYRAADGCHREWLEQRKRIESPLKVFLTTINPFHRIILYLERRIYQREGCKKIIAISSKGKEDIMKYYQPREEKITVIYNGVDCKRFSPTNRNIYRNETRMRYGISESNIVILFVGSGFERKGLKFLLQGAGLIKSRLTIYDPRFKDGIKILVVGKGDCAYYERMAKRLGIEEDIIFVGTTKEIERFYACSDIFILPSIYDPFGNACLEAMASGLPVITTENAGASEIIENGKEGFILEDPSNVNEMATNIRLLMDKGLRETIGKRARKKAEKFTIKDAVSKMVNICDKS